MSSAFKAVGTQFIVLLNYDSEILSLIELVANKIHPQRFRFSFHEKSKDKIYRDPNKLLALDLFYLLYFYNLAHSKHITTYDHGWQQQLCNNPTHK